MGETGDQDDAGQRIDIPGHKAKNVSCEDRQETGRADCHRIAKGQHQCRDEHGHQHDHLQSLAKPYIGAGQQEGEGGAQRDGDRHHAHSHDDRVPQSVVKHRVDENILIGTQPDRGTGAEERAIEKALIEDQGDRGKDAQSQQADNQPSERQRLAGARNVFCRPFRAVAWVRF